MLILTLRPGDDQEERRLALDKAFLEQEGREVLPRRFADAPAGGAAGGSFSKDDHPMGGGPLGKLRASGGADFHQ